MTPAGSFSLGPASSVGLYPGGVDLLVHLGGVDFLRHLLVHLGEVDFLRHLGGILLHLFVHLGGVDLLLFHLGGPVGW